MRQKVISIIIGLLALSIQTVAAQGTTSVTTFHGPELYEAQGPVKEIKLKTKNPIPHQDKVKFTKDGKIDNALMTYNQAGYPIGFGSQFGKRGISLKIGYNEKNQVDTISLVATMGKAIDVNFINLYSPSGNLIGLRSNKNSPDGSSSLVFEFEYSEIINDDHGNWTSRKVVQKTLKSDREPTVEEYIENRTIKYWD